MHISSLLPPEAVIVGLKSTSHKQVLQDISTEFSTRTGVDAHVLFESLLQRERLGTTAIGQGIAVPHARVPGLDALAGLFVRLPKGIDFDSQDGEPVDLIFALLAPEEAGADHLQALACIARLFRTPGMAQKLRQTSDAGALHAILIDEPVHKAA